MSKTKVYTDGRPRLQRDWEGKKVKSLRKFSNHDFVFPEGTEFVISSVSWKGIGLRLLKTCEACGIGRYGYISGIKGDEIEFICEAS